MSSGSTVRSRIYSSRKKGPLSHAQRANALLWQPDPSQLGSTLKLRSGLRVRTMRMSRPRLAGRSLLFFSDTHIRTAGICGFFPFVRQRGGTDWLTNAFRELFETIPEPDCILFGGDLVGDAAWMEPAMEFLRTFPSAPRKLAVGGNWELRRRWIHVERWRDIFARGGCELLLNEPVEAAGIRFWGMDDAKEGDSLYTVPRIPAGTDCILSHNPDSAAAQLTAPLLEGSPLILSGHTHGGQFRLPGFGAVVTSSRFGKRFEYGAYRYAPTGAEMYVCAGIGATWFHARILCPPEVLLINFC
jgi:predicted MPP superfamily phosphohydrolase